jgi:uncharacterized protein (DUF2164 family)
MSVLDNLTPQQLAELRAKAQAKLQQRATKQRPQPQQPTQKEQQQQIGGVLTKALIRADVKNKTAKRKADSKLNIYKSGKYQRVTKTDIVESIREQLASKYNTLLAERDGYIESDKLMKNYAKKLFELEKEVQTAKERIETPLEDYVELLKQRELEKAQFKKKVGFLTKTLFTFGYYAYSQGKKERNLKTGYLGVEK